MWIAAAVYACHSPRQSSPGADPTPTAPSPSAALDNASLTEHCLLLDVDFVCGEGMHDRLVDELAKREVLVGELDALIIPAFEAKFVHGATASTAVAQSRATVAALVAVGKVEGFHVSRYAKGHSATDFKRWLELENEEVNAEVYPAQHVNGFEPYVVVKRNSVSLPRYDERFRGYGLNKVVHVVALARAGYSFKVAPWSETLVVAPAHPYSDAYEATYGARKDPLQALRVQALYNVALRELEPERHPPAAWSPAPTPVATPPAADPTDPTMSPKLPEAETLDKLTVVQVANEADDDAQLDLISYSATKLLLVVLVLMAMIVLLSRISALADGSVAGEGLSKQLGPLVAEGGGLRKVISAPIERALLRGAV